MTNSFRTEARETAKAKLGRLTGKQFLTNAVADRGLPPLLGEVGGGSANEGKSVNRAFGGWVPGGVAKGRLDRARGGRVKNKGKTTVNVIVSPGPGGGAGANAPPPMPPVPPPPPPPMPPGGPPGGPGGAGGNPLMQALAMRGAAVGGLGGPPGPPPMMRKRGGAVKGGVSSSFTGAVENAKEGGVKHEYTGGAGSGVGRLQIVKAYGKKAYEK